MIEVFPAPRKPVNTVIGIDLCMADTMNDGNYVT